MDACLGLSAPPAVDPVFVKVKRFAKAMAQFQVRATGAHALLPN